MAEWLKAAARIQYGSVAERLKAPVLKTGNGKPFVGSNPTASAIAVYGCATDGMDYSGICAGSCGFRIRVTFENVRVTATPLF